MHGAQQGDLGGRHAQAFGVGGEHRVAVEDGAQVSVFHLDGDDAVVGQQPLVDGVGQGEAEDDRAVEVQIVHRCDFDVDREVLAGLDSKLRGVAVTKSRWWAKICWLFSSSAQGLARLPAVRWASSQTSTSQGGMWNSRWASAIFPSEW